MADFMDFFAQLMQNPALLITVLLTLAVILVNGWTDAPKDVYKRQSLPSLSVTVIKVTPSFVADETRHRCV